jgi:hypothetical protein
MQQVYFRATDSHHFPSQLSKIAQQQGFSWRSAVYAISSLRPINFPDRARIRISNRNHRSSPNLSPATEISLFN